MRTPISYVKKCSTCDTEVEWEEINRGYEYEKGKFVLFEKEELEQLADAGGKEIEIVDFVDLQEIDPIYFQKTYYLSPGIPERTPTICCAKRWNGRSGSRSPK